MSTGIEMTSQIHTFSDGSEKESAVKPDGLTQVRTADEFRMLSSTLGMDTLARVESEDHVRSLLEGIDLTSTDVELEAYYLRLDNEPVAVMTIAVAPKWWMAEQKVLLIKDGRLIYHTLASLLGNDQLPEHAIMPRWTKVADEYLGKFAIPGYRFLTKRIDELANFVPKPAWLYAVASGHHWVSELPDGIEPGMNIDAYDLGIDPDLVGTNQNGSNSSVKFGRKNKMVQIPDIGVFPSLGPAFFRSIE